VYEQLQKIDRRIVYLLVFVVTGALLKWPVRLPVVVSPEGQEAYNLIQNTAPEKLVLVAADWDAGTLAENGNQTRALIRHLMKLKRKFAIIGFAWPAGPQLTENIASELAPDYGYEYGRDYVNLGYKPQLSVSLMALVKDIPGFYKQDAKGTPLSQLPVMQGIHGIEDVSAIAQFTSASTLEAYIVFVWGPYKTPLVHGCTAIIAPQQYVYLDAGQIEGLLVGLRGAAEYENLVGHPDVATELMAAQSFVHLLIMVLIILGNIGYLGARRAARRAEASV